MQIMILIKTLIIILKINHSLILNIVKIKITNIQKHNNNYLK